MRSISTILSAKTKQALQTLGNSGDPKMAVYSSRAKTTITDASYWTVETIRATTGLGDVSVAPRRFKSYGKPNRLYEIHVKDGEVSTAIREYPDKLKQGWQPQFTLGPSAPSGGSVAIAFNGYWERYRKLWRLITEEKPWIFWVDSTGVLWRQHWDDISTLAQLDTGVTRVRAIRAWKNVNLADQDQGIVVGYVKTDGTVWYRNYCQQADYSYIWENARQLTQFTGTAVTLNMFIANDYRMGFIIEDSIGQIHWLVTPRNWAGMAIENHVITVTPSAEVDLIAVTYHDLTANEIITVASTATIEMLFGRTDNTLVELMNTSVTKLDDDLVEYQDWGFKINVKLNFPTETNPIVTLIDATTLSAFVISSIDMISDTEFNLNIDDVVHEFGINGAEGNISVTITGMTNEAGYSYDTIIQEFTPINLVPPEIPLPVVEVIWNE